MHQTIRKKQQPYPSGIPVNPLTVIQTWGKPSCRLIYCSISAKKTATGGWDSEPRPWNGYKTLFLGKVVEKVIVLQLQKVTDDYLKPFQSGYSLTSASTSSILISVPFLSFWLFWSPPGLFTRTDLCSLLSLAAAEACLSWVFLTLLLYSWHSISRCKALRRPCTASERPCDASSCLTKGQARCTFSAAGERSWQRLPREQ